MTDVFHEAVPADFISRMFEVMARADWHIFQILTKRDERLAALASRLPWLSHIWQGVSIENAEHVRRADSLRDVAAAIRFLSLEPLLGPLPKLSLAGIHWVIVGGESGPKHRPIKPEWVRDIREQCIAAGVPFFFKQWGGHTPKAGGRLLDGRTWEQYP
jgi:protein gp37